MNLKEYLIALKNKGNSDLDIARITRVSQPTISRHRKGQGDSTKIHPSTAKALADGFRHALKYIDNKPHFYPIEDDDPAPPQSDYGTVAKKYAGSLGYDGTPEGLDMFLRECRGKYRTLHTIRKLLSNSEGDEQSKIDNQ